MRAIFSSSTLSKMIFNLNYDKNSLTEKRASKNDNQSCYAV